MKPPQKSIASMTNSGFLHFLTAEPELLVRTWQYSWGENAEEMAPSIITSRFNFYFVVPPIVFSVSSYFVLF